MLHTPHGWWLDEAGPVSAEPRLEGVHEADVVVVGGGYTGLWTAWHVLEHDPGARVAIVEAELAGHGPSGRNGGFCESLWLALPRLRRRLGDADARRLAEASSESVLAVGAWCAEQDVDAWFDQSGYMLVSTAAAQDGAGHAAVEAARAVEAPDRVVALDRAGVSARCASPAFRGGVLVPDYATLQPARLALGLRRRLIERGAAIFERSPVTRLAVTGRRAVEVAAGDGTVRAQAGVLAMGAASRGVAPLRSRLSVTSSHIVLTEPVPDVIEAAGWTGGEGITDGRTLLHYMRTTRDGRIAYGWGGGRPAFGARVRGRAAVDPTLTETIAEALIRVFPALRGRALTHAWGGPIDVSPSHLAQIGSLPGAPVHYAFGFTGNGVGPSHLAGRILSSLALDRRDEASRLPLVEPERLAVPPEPIAWLGGSLVRRAFLRRDRLEEEGRRIDPVTRAVCAAPRAFGIHVGR